LIFQSNAFFPSPAASLDVLQAAAYQPPSPPTHRHHARAEAACTKKVPVRLRPVCHRWQPSVEILGEVIRHAACWPQPCLWAWRYQHSNTTNKPAWQQMHSFSP